MAEQIKKDDTRYIPSRFGFRIRQTQSDAEKDGGVEKCDPQAQLKDVIDCFMSELHDFAGIMHSLLSYTKQVGEVAHNTRNARCIELYNALKDVVESPKSKKKALYELCIYYRTEDDGEDITKVFPIYDAEKARNIRELEDVEDLAPQILCETVLQQLVNRWESHLANIIRIHYSTNPKLLTNKVELTYEQLLRAKEHGSISSIFVERLTSVALEGGIEDHLRFLRENKELNLDFGKYFTCINELKEVMYHRDIVVHCDGIASQRHCERMQGICTKDALPKVGSRVRTDYGYVMRSWDIVYAAGCVLSHLVARHFSAKAKITGAVEGPDDAFVNLSFEALKEGRFKAAQILLEYALSDEMIGESESVLALRVNLALAYKYTDQKKKFLAIVNARDWDSRDEKYKVVIAVLRNNYKEAYALIRNICKHEPSYLNYVYDWVVYEDLRKDPMFEREMSKIKAFKSFVPKRGRRAVLDFSAKPSSVRDCVSSFFRSIIPENEQSGGER